MWAPGWERKGDPLKNLDLVKELFALYRAHPAAELEWIAAHSGYRWNEYAETSRVPGVETKPCVDR